MTPLQCILFRRIQRAGAGLVLLVLFTSRALLAQATILPRDAAVREYEIGLQALKKKDFWTAIDRMNAALATGHTRPSEKFGTSGHELEWYDPYYWLGVAYMELGENAPARRYFTRSREGGVIGKRAESADLDRRMRVLDAQEAARRPPPPPPAKTTSSTGPRPAPTVRIRPGKVSLIPLIEAIAQARFGEADAELTKVRAASPEAAEPELLAAVLYASRFVLEGSVDGTLLARAKTSLDTFRQRGGSHRAEEAWLSPALRALLGG
ncbi:MAG TPA: hypothetical protein VL084_03420 [Thermoanaerobaculia bacterium]|nr:hypothetical protein [Thermoanaerobaculia bacterium]